MPENRHYHEEYSEYAKNVRFWFVAYGVGGPALILSHDAVYNSIKTSGQAISVAVAYFVAVVVQIITAMLYKAAAWNLYITVERGHRTGSR
jgi:hypothetical protein